MTNQTTKKSNMLNNLKKIHDFHTSGEILSLLRDIRENMSVADNLSNSYNAKLKERKQEKGTPIVAQASQKDIAPVEVVAEKLSVKTEEEKLEERKLFEEQVMSIGQKKQSRPNSPKPKEQSGNYGQKRVFNPADRQPRQFNQGTAQNNFQRPFNNNTRQFNNPNQSGGFNNTPRPFNNANRPFTNNQAGGFNNANRPFNNNNRPFTNNASKPFGTRPQGTGQGFGKPQFSSTKANGFKNFNQAPTETIVVQQERSNYGNKNKSTYRTDEKKQTNRRTQQRRGYIDLDIDNEERTSFRKLAKPKKKEESFIAPTIKNAVITTENITVKTLSEKIGKPAGAIIKQLMLLGIMAMINSAIDFTTAELVASELGVELEQKVEKTYEEKLIDASNTKSEADGVKRPPVVTIMGHVDHGKTSLLDTIRKTNVASGEAGGITQKIGAYSIVANNEKVTFIDTPGHAAFTAMRARGAKITDIAILVVAADDGLMPQSIEAINHIKMAKVPMIVAINKMDTAGANPERIKTQLAENGVLPEEWGGETILVPLSAKTGVGIDKLLDSIFLVAEMLDLKANPDKKATGTIIEAELDKNRGPVATILVQSGTLKVGDSIMSGVTFGKIRAMFNENGKQLKEATPSTPVSVLGFYDVPSTGEQVFAVDEKLSKNVISERKNKIKEEQSKETSGVSLDNFMERVNEGKLKTLNIIIKADTQGSVEALKQTLTAISNEEVRIVCIHSAVGNVTESDLVLAQTSGAIIVNFNLKVLPKIQSVADNIKVQIKQYNVIYDIVDELTDTINGMLTIKYEQVVAGHAEVKAVFKLSSNGLIAGSYVLDGKIIRNAMARLIRDGEIIADTNITALKIVKDDKAEIGSGYECGIKLKDVPDLKEGDIIECYQNVPIKRV